jgi:hypothetical protein
MMPTVYLCSQTNSTFFTTCCHAAICDDQAKCPKCKAEITPRSHKDRWNVAYGPWRKRNRGAEAVYLHK